MLHRIMLDVELGIVGIQKKTELPISSCERPLQEFDQFKNNYCVFLWNYQGYSTRKQLEHCSVSW